MAYADILVATDTVALVIGLIALVILHRVCRSLGDAAKKSFHFIILGVISMMGASVYILTSVYLNIADAVDILSIQAVLMFAGLVFFIAAAYNFVETEKE